MEMDSANLPLYGTAFHRDFRTAVDQPQKSTVRVVIWNIERGYQLEGIKKELQKLDPDILMLQEVDIFTGRFKNAGKEQQDGNLKIDMDKEIGQALNMNSVSAVEMSMLAGGIQCNTIMTKYDFKEWGALPHATRPIDWPTLGPECVQNGLGSNPRKGLRTAAKATVATPIGDIQVYCDHFEMYCGMEGRLGMLGDLLDDCRSSPGLLQIVGGDLNTFCDGVAKLVKRSRTPLNWALFGKISETDFWNEAIFSPKAKESEYHKTWAHILPQNLDPPFSDPFGNEPTVSKYWSLFATKLDWGLLRGLKCVDKFIGNKDLALSDHMYLCLDVSLL